MKTIKHFYSWLVEQEEGFSSQLLRILRDTKTKLDIRDVRELLHLGANPNYKLLGHSDEERIDKFIDIAREEEWDLKEFPRVKMYKMASIVYPIFHSNPDILRVMLEYGGDPDLDISDVSMATGSKTPFMYAARQMSKYNPKSVEVLDALVDEGANVNVTDSDGNNAIHLAVLSGKFDSIKKLVEIGVDPFKKNNTGKMPIDLIDPWNNRYVVDGKQMSGSEVKRMFKDLLAPPEGPAKQKFSIFRKKR